MLKHQLLDGHGHLRSLHVLLHACSKQCNEDFPLHSYFSRTGYSCQGGYQECYVYRIMLRVAVNPYCTSTYSAATEQITLCVPAARG